MRLQDRSRRRYPSWGGLGLALALVLAGPLAGCSAAAVESPPVLDNPVAPATSGDPVAGRQVWDSNGCGACHALAAAQANGTVGPNLDETSLTFDQISARVAQGKDTMPPYAGLLSTQEIADVSRFVLVAAAGEAPLVQAVTAAPAGEGEKAEEESTAHVDLTPFVEAWSSGDLKAIRDQYAEQALYLSAEEVVASQHREPVSAAVQDETFAEDVKQVKGMRMRMIGEPQRVTDKQVMFFFRWEGEAEGTNGVALLRYEGGKVWMHVYALDDQPTPNPAPGEMEPEAFDVEPLMQAWRDAETERLRDFYTDDLAIFNDEDILRAEQGAYHTQAELDGGYLQNELRQQGDWGMSATPPAMRLGDLVLFPWHWATIDYPAGYGVRMLRLDGDRISQDIRYALRPWEVGGGSFASGY